MSNKSLGSDCQKILVCSEGYLQPLKRTVKCPKLSARAAVQDNSFESDIRTFWYANRNSN
jgi:hypothetical protein